MKNMQLPYELHVTIREGDIDLFRETCKQLGVKPLLIHAQLQSGEKALNDLQTSSIIKGTWTDVCNELTRIKQALEEAGMTVIREKVETIPDHPDAPSLKKKQLDMPLGCYFEAHIPVKIESSNWKNARFALLHEIAERNHAHLSRNAFKEYEEGFVFMMTLRDSTLTKESFGWLVYKLEDELHEEGFETNLPGTATIEFACYDSNIMHDNGWLRKGPPISRNVIIPQESKDE